MKLYILTRYDQDSNYKPRVYTTREAAVACMIVEYEDTKNIYGPNYIDKAEIGKAETGDSYAQITLRKHNPYERKRFDRWAIWEVEV